MFTWFSRGVLKKFRPLDQQLTLERIFSPCLGQITVFSQIPGYFQNHAFFHLRTNLEFCFGQIPDFTLSRDFTLDKFRILHYPGILHEQIPDFTLSQDFTFDKFRILHYPGILPWTNPEFRAILKLPCF